MAGLFDGAKFGDRFKTRGGDMAIYGMAYGAVPRNNCVKLMVKYTERDGRDYLMDIIVYYETGKRIYVGDAEMDRFDIVSRWED